MPTTTGSTLHNLNTEKTLITVNKHETHRKNIFLGTGVLSSEDEETSSIAGSNSVTLTFTKRRQITPLAVELIEHGFLRSLIGSSTTVIIPAPPPIPIVR